ncbi:stress responsive A/B barrel domain-containing protein [Peziza echinospora]|nr:stress responsive A/B barrel domain-containing protein [Peziza echinospora]
MADTQVTHIVMFKFYETVSQEDIAAIVTSFRLLPTLCIHPATGQTYITHPLLHGTNNSTEGLDEGITHIFIATFPGGVDDRDYYVTQDPAHLAFIASLDKKVEKAIVVDFAGV